jgi:hypothetical protein
MANGIIGSPLTALTASIIFDGVEIGQMQELIVEENFNVKPIEQIGSSYITAYLPGTYNGRITASRAYLDSDLFFDKLTPGITASNALVNVVNDMIGDGSIDIRPEVKTVEALSAFWTTLFSGKTPLDRFSFVVNFNIELKNPQNEIFAKLENCVLTSRSLSVTINNIVVMQNIACVYQKRSI